MNNKKIISLLITGLMLVPTATYAKDNSKGAVNNAKEIVTEAKAKNATDVLTTETDSNSKVKGAEQKELNQAKKVEKKEQIEIFKTEMKAKHEAIKVIKLQIQDLRKEVEAKRNKLEAITEDLKLGKKTITEDMLEDLSAKAADIKLDTDAINATAEVTTDVEATQVSVNKSDFNNALTSLDKVIAKFQARLDALKQLNTDLDLMLGTAKLAADPAPTVIATPTPTPTNIPAATDAPTATPSASPSN